MPSSGAHVSWPEGRGQVDLVVTRGVVPGVAGAVAAHDAPLARVEVWEPGPDGWRPTQTKVAVPVGDLVEVPPPGISLTGRAVQERLVALVAEHDQMTTQMGMPSWSRPPGVAVKAVFDRGHAAWPGERATPLDREGWALARVEAFLAMASGAEVPGYRRDLDLLPPGHPAGQGAT